MCASPRCAGADQHRVRDPPVRAARKAIALGWPAEQIVVIDTDQGQSGASAADREGFQRLVAEVGMGRAGIVLGLEVSRLARNNADWHRLLEICALTGTLICDEDGLYDPARLQRPAAARAEGHHERGRAALHPGPAARRAAVQGPPRRAADAAAGRAGLRPGRAGRARPRHRRAATPCATCSPRSTRTGSARAVVKAFNRRRAACSRPASAPAPARASWPGSRCGTGGCCARCTTPAMPARSPTAGAATGSGADGKTTPRQTCRASNGSR